MRDKKNPPKLTPVDLKEVHRFRKYFTYIVIFPNGVEWIKQEPLVHDLEWHLRQMGREHKDNWDWRHYLNDLFRKQEASWKDNFGIRHIIKIEAVKRPQNWGTQDTGLGRSLHNVGEGGQGGLLV